MYYVTLWKDTVNQLKANDLSKVGNQARELQNKTIGIFGFGRIGQLVAERLKPFNVTIQHYDPINQKDNENSKFVEFEELVKQVMQSLFTHH